MNHTPLPRPTTLSKGELALQYMPNSTVQAARRTLRRWVLHNTSLHQALIDTGWTDRTALLTPAQVALHYQYLGAP